MGSLFRALILVLIFSAGLACRVWIDTQTHGANQGRSQFSFFKKEDDHKELQCAGSPLPCFKKPWGSEKSSTPLVALVPENLFVFYESVILLIKVGFIRPVSFHTFFLLQPPRSLALV
jgi:hypothetical protein